VTNWKECTKLKRKDSGGMGEGGSICMKYNAEAGSTYWFRIQLRSAVHKLCIWCCLIAILHLLTIAVYYNAPPLILVTLIRLLKFHLLDYGDTPIVGPTMFIHSTTYGFRLCRIKSRR
jgi:hypothetical protein